MLSREVEPLDHEILCWAVVQIHCYCTIDETRVLYNEVESLQSSSVISSTDTSFNPCLGLKGEKGRVLYSSKPKILFCDLNLRPEEMRAFAYYETIPEWVPPSYNGLKVKYQYKLSIGTQRINSIIQLLRIPIRILSIPNQNFNSIPNSITNSIETNHKIPNETETNGEINESFEGSNRKDSVVSTHSSIHSPFDSSETVLDLSLHRLDCLTAKRCPQSYELTNPFGKVAKFCIMKSTYKLGEDIVGIFNFTEATVPCVQV